MLKIKAKPKRLKCKGYDLGDDIVANSTVGAKLSLSSKLSLDTRVARFGKALCKGFPVLSIFAFIGIMGVCLNPGLQNLFKELFPVSTCSAACAPDTDTSCPTGSVWDNTQCACISTKGSSTSLVIDNNVIKDEITAVRGDVAYASHSVGVNADNIGGYTLTITGPATISTQDDKGNSVSSATTLSAAGNKTPANMANNSWGYAWGNSSDTESTMAYQSFTGSAKTIETNASVNGSITLAKKLVFAAKFDTNATEGHYKATVNLGLTVTPKTITTLANMNFMQEMTPEACAFATTGYTKTLYDSRDSSSYTVKKMSDGNCWMTQNLRIVNKTITSANSDVTSDFIIPASSTSGFSSDTAANAYYGNNTTYGAYYTWCTATAGTCSAATSAGMDATSSICPKGWYLPKGGTTVAKNTSISQTGNDFANVFGYTGTLSTSTNIFSTVGATFASSTLTHNSTTWPAAGYYAGSAASSVGSYGFCWSRTANSSTYAYGLSFYSSGLSPAVSSARRRGYSVRCVAYSSS